MNAPVDISPGDLETVREILAEHIPEYEVLAFGSRVAWTARQYSDLDLAVMTEEPLDIMRMADLKEAFAESDLSFRVDIADWAATSENFRKIICREFSIVQKKPKKNSEWLEISLSEIVDLVGGGTPRRNNPEYWNGTIPWLSVKDFNHDRRYVNEAEESITELGLANSNTKLLPEGHLIISARGTVGAISQLSEPMAFNQSCYGINARTNYTTNNFLYYLIKYHIDNFKRISHGAVFDTITRKTFQHINVSIPPLPEQCSIANILAILDDKIELNRKMSKTLEAIAQVLFKSWFIDFDPVHAKMKGLDAVLPQNMAHIFPDRLVESEIGKIPEGWKVKPLDKIADFHNGLALQKHRPQGDEDWLPVVKIAQLRSGKTESGEKSTASIQAESIINDGDVVFSWSGTLMVKIWCGGRAALNQHLFKVTSTKFPKWFFMHCIRSHLLGFQAIAAGKATTMGHIRRHHLSEAMCAVPNSQLLTEADGLLALLLEKSISLNVQSRTTSAIRDALLPKLISGQLRVKDAEAFLEGVL